MVLKNEARTTRFEEEEKMKRMKQWLAVILAALLVCGMLPAMAETPSVTVQNKQKITMNVGDTLRFNTGLEGPVTWKSRKAKVASVDENGVVTAHAEGSATIKAKAGKKTVSVKVTVADPFKPQSVSFSVGPEIQLTLQDTLTLKPVLTPASARAAFTWKSSKPKVLVVEDGVLKPVAEGVATVTVRTQNKKTAKVKVKVVDPYKPDSVSLNATGTVTLKPGETLALKPSVSPASARASYAWKSSKAKVATVDGNGLVTAVGKGSAKITVTTQNKKKATVTVKVETSSGGGSAPMRMSQSRYRYFRKYMSQSEFDAALAVVRPGLEKLMNASPEDQVYGVWELLTEEGFDYSMREKHYNDPYGLLVRHVASCAGTARTAGFCLSLLGYEYEHVHESKNDHQWVRLQVNGVWWICDPFSIFGYVGPEGDRTQPIEVRDENGRVIFTTYAYIID